MPTMVDQTFFVTELLVFCLSFTHETLSLRRIIVLHLEAVTTLTLFPASTDSKVGTILLLFIGKHSLSNIANCVKLGFLSKTTT